MVCCAITNCSSDSNKVGAVNRGISFFRFPKDPHIKNKWIEATGRKNWFPTKYSRICSIHFHEDTFTGPSKYRRVISTAYPTIDVVMMSNDEKVINGQLYREKDCHFPSRCAGIEHYLSALASKMPDLELAINTRDWPQFNRLWGHKNAPVFSFSKTKDYFDIMYPAWSFWEGGPAISLYPTGIGRWDKHRLSISAAAERWPWDKKEEKAFFRGSRTSEERDPLILLSRSNPDLVDAQYTKNQAWKSDADTLYAPPASEVSFEDHCKYKYLFNYRGVAASFRLKHLFLCKSLVFHVGNDWLEFFYPSLKPWVHYVPISPKARQDEIKRYIEYFKMNDSLAKEIADRGFQHIWDNLRDKDVKCYWRQLLKRYAKLIKYEVKKDESLIKV